MKCSVAKCKNTQKDKGIGFHTFPKDPNLLKQWMQFCRRKVNPKVARICSDHFLPEDFKRSLQFEMGFSNFKAVQPGAVPTVYKKEASTSDAARHSRAIKRSNKKMVADLLKNETEYVSQNISPTIENLEEDISNPESSPEDSSNELMQDADALKMENVHLRELISKQLEQIKKLKQKIHMLNKENAALRETKKQPVEEIPDLTERLTQLEFEQKNTETKLRAIFTKGQIRKIKSNLRRGHWSEEDIAHSITLYSTSTKAYRLLKEKDFPLPSIRTLQQWALKITIAPGIIEPVMQMLSAAVQLTEKQKLCVLSFDEMKLRKCYCYDKSSDTTYAPADYVQVAMIRGLIARWKQPVFYNFDFRMTHQLLFSIIERLESSGYNVVAVVSDLGGANGELFRELGVDENNPWFLYVDNPIFVFPDAPHLIKMLRNHYLDHGFIINNKPVRKEIIAKLLSLTSSQLSTAHKINQSHLNVVGAQRQEVKMATKLFSNSIAQAITRGASLGHLSEHNWEECHRLFKTTNDWFDVMNSKVAYPNCRERMYAYGLALDIQDDILNGMTEMVEEMRVIGEKTLLPFQKGILQCNRALRLLQQELEVRYNVKYVLTYRLNQDVLGNFFEVMRSKAGQRDHPDRLEFENRLRAYILGFNEGKLSDTADLEISSHSLTGKMFNGILLEPENEIEQAEETELNCLELDSLENLADYICHKLHFQVSNIIAEEACEEEEWLNHLIEDDVTKPTPAVMAVMRALQEVFDEINDEGLFIASNYTDALIANAEHIQCDLEIKKVFFRSRMFNRIHTLNKTIADNARKRKIKNTVTRH